jgi:hypothetical protein
MQFNILGGLLPFKPREALKDAFAGLTLASMNIPQVLGYTRIAGTPVVTGLYTVLLPVVAFAVFGSSRHLVVAADSATAVIFSSSLSQMAPAASEKYMALVGMLTRLTAGLLIAARMFKLGFLADFLSRTALIGFLSGVGVRVGVAMLGGMLGMEVQSRRTIAQLWELLHGAWTQRAQRGSVGRRSREHPCWPPVGAAISCLAYSRRRDDRRQRMVSSSGTRLCAHRPGSGRLPFAQVAGREPLRHPRTCARCRVMLRDDHRARRRDVARLWSHVQGARQRECGHPGFDGCQRSGRGQRSFRRKREPDPDRDGLSSGREKARWHSSCSPPPCSSCRCS